MTNLELRIRILDEKARRVNNEIEGPEDEAEVAPLLTMIRTYRSEIMRQLNDAPADLGYVDTLKEAIRLGGWLMHEVQEHEPDALRGWFYGAPAANNAQRFYSFGAQVAHELTMAVMRIEAQLLSARVQ